MNEWPFADPPNVAVFTSKSIVKADDWIHHVTHDEDDGAWQFHPSTGPAPEEEAAVVALKTVLQLDPSVGELADLPLGWEAWRTSRTASWQRRRKGE